MYSYCFFAFMRCRNFSSPILAFTPPFPSSLLGPDRVHWWVRDVFLLQAQTRDPAPGTSAPGWACVHHPSQFGTTGLNRWIWNLMGGLKVAIFPSRQDPSHPFASMLRGKEGDQRGDPMQDERIPSSHGKIGATLPYNYRMKRRYSDL